MSDPYIIILNKAASFFAACCRTVACTDRRELQCTQRSVRYGGAAAGMERGYYSGMPPAPSNSAVAAWHATCLCAMLQFAAFTWLAGWLGAATVLGALQFDSIRSGPVILLQQTTH